MKNGELPHIGGQNEIPMYATLFKIALMDSQWLLSKRNNKDLKFDTKSKNNNNIISAIINVISIYIWIFLIIKKWVIVYMILLTILLMM